MVLQPKTPLKSNGVILPLWLRQAIREGIQDIGDFEHRGVLQCFIHEERSEAEQNGEERPFGEFACERFGH